MFVYEIRVFPPGGGAPRMSAVTLAGDFIAIRRAQALTPGGHGVEVWRGADCVFAAPRRAAPGSGSHAASVAS